MRSFPRWLCTLIKGFGIHQLRHVIVVVVVVSAAVVVSALVAFVLTRDFFQAAQIVRPKLQKNGYTAHNADRKCK